MSSLLDTILTVKLTVVWCRYQIKYSVSDYSGAAAAPLTIDITFVEVAFVTGGFLFIAQADSVNHAQQHAAQLSTAGTDANTAIIADLATVLHTWLTSATSTYVSQMTAHLGADNHTVATVNTLKLGTFSAVVPSDVKVLNASIDWTSTAAVNTNNAAATQKYALRVVVQVAVLTSNMLQSVYVDILSDVNGTSNLSSKRRLQGTSDSNLLVSLLPSPEPPPMMQTTRDHIPASNGLSRGMGSSLFQRILQQTGSLTATVLASAWEDLHAQVRNLLATSPGASFPLASLLAFKRSLVLAGFDGTTGCSTDSLKALFYTDSQAPAGISDICVGNGSAADYSMNAALLASASPSVPLLQVCCAAAWFHHPPISDMHPEAGVLPKLSHALALWSSPLWRPQRLSSCKVAA